LWKRRAALTIQDGCQVRPSDADPINVKGVFGKSVGSNFGVRATSPGAFGILSEIAALDLGSEGRFRSGHNRLLICLLSVGRIDVVGAHQAEHNPEELVAQKLNRHRFASRDAVEQILAYCVAATSGALA
jgi:hypothetical protein